MFQFLQAWTGSKFERANFVPVRLGMVVRGDRLRHHMETISVFHPQRNGCFFEWSQDFWLFLMEKKNNQPVLQ